MHNVLNIYDKYYQDGLLSIDIVELIKIWASFK